MAVHMLNFSSSESRDLSTACIRLGFDCRKALLADALGPITKLIRPLVLLKHKKLREAL